VRLLDVFGMAFLLRESQQVTNGGAVTLTGVNTLIAAAASMDFSVGDFALLQGRARATKGATAGATHIQLVKDSGTAVFEWIPGTSDVYEHMDPNVPAAAIFDAYLTTLLRCLTAGSAVFATFGLSLGSNSTVGVNRGCIEVKRLRA